MLEWLIGKLLWLYWRANRPFLVRFAPALIGPNPANPDLEPDGRAVIRELDRLLSLMTTAVFVQAASSVLAMPLWVPKRLPYSPVWRTLLFLFVPVWSRSRGSASASAARRRACASSTRCSAGSATRRRPRKACRSRASS
jgi:hypothetical protein